MLAPDADGGKRTRSSATSAPFWRYNGNERFRSPTQFSELVAGAMFEYR